METTLDELKEKVARLKESFNSHAGKYPGNEYFARWLQEASYGFEQADIEIRNASESSDHDMLRSTITEIEGVMPALEQFNEEEPERVSREELLEHLPETIDSKLPELHIEGSVGITLGAHESTLPEIEKTLTERKPEVIVDCGAGAGEKVEQMTEIIERHSLNSNIIAFDIDKDYRDFLRGDAPPR